MDQSDRFVGTDNLSIYHPNNPPLVLGMLIWCVAKVPVVAFEAGMDTS